MDAIHNHHKHPLMDNSSRLTSEPSATDDLDSFFAQLTSLNDELEHGCGANHHQSSRDHDSLGMSIGSISSDCAPLLNERETNAFSNFLENVLEDPNYLFEPKLMDGLPGVSQLALDHQQPEHLHAIHINHHVPQPHDVGAQSGHLAHGSSDQLPSLNNAPSSQYGTVSRQMSRPHLYTSSFDEQQMMQDGNHKIVSCGIETHHLLPDTQYFLEGEKESQQKRLEMERAQRDKDRSLSQMAIFKEISAVTAVSITSSSSSSSPRPAQENRPPEILSQVDESTRNLPSLSTNASLSVNPVSASASASMAASMSRSVSVSASASASTKTSQTTETHTIVRTPIKVESRAATPPIEGGRIVPYSEIVSFNGSEPHFNSLKRKYSMTPSDDGYGGAVSKKKRDSLSDDQKRFNHLSSEQKRRDTIKGYLDELCCLIPKGNDMSGESSRPKKGNGAGKSKKVILRHVYDHMVQIVSRNQAMRAMFMANGISTSGIPDSSTNR